MCCVTLTATKRPAFSPHIDDFCGLESPGITRDLAMTNTPLPYRSIQQLLTDLCSRGFSDAAIARFIDCRPETIARVRVGAESGRNIAGRLLILADAYNQCRLSR